MRLKGIPSLYWIQHDAYDKLWKRLFYEYGIEIHEDGYYSGYIKKNVRYQVRFPILQDGEIVSFLNEHVYVREVYSLADARRIIIQRWKMEPDYFEACYKSMHKKGAH